MRYVEINKLQEGMIVAKDITDIFDRILIVKNTELTSHLINKLKLFKLFGIYIEDEWSSDIFVDPVVDDELSNETILALQNIDLDKIHICAAKIVENILNSDELFCDIETLKEYDEDTFEHSLNVAINAVTMGIGLGYNFYRLKNLAMGSILHDIGKQGVPIEIINKCTKLTSEEYDIVKNHPTYGYELLCKNVTTYSATRQIVYQHHENWDGGGYPRGLKGREIYTLAMIVHICDVFDSLVSKRPYKEGFSFRKTIELLEEGRGTMFDPDLLDYFFKYVPIYHKGTCVRLSNGEEALIYKNNRGNMLRPIVKLRNGKILNLKESEIEIIS